MEEDFRQRLVRFYSAVDEGKVANVDAIVKKQLPAAEGAHRVL